MPINSYTDRPLSWIPSADVRKSRPIYLSLAAQLEDDILANRLPEGCRLPPQRELADFLDLDFTTVTRAYNICRYKGLVHGVTGRGTFVASLGSAEDSAGVIDCGVVHGFAESGTSEITAAARDVLARPSASSIFSYRNRDGSPSSIIAAQKWLSMHGVEVDTEHIAVFPGAQGAISAALLALFHPGDAIAVDEFTYANFISLAKLAHLRLIPIPSDKKGMRPDVLRKESESQNIKGIFIMPWNANPTGRTLSEKRKTELAQVILDRSLLIIEDDAKLLLPKRNERPLFAHVPDQTIYIAGSTRNIAPGIRATFMAFPGHLSGRILNALHHLTIKAGTLDAEILAELILSGRAEKILDRKAAKACEANALFDKIFPSAPKGSGTALFRTLPLPGTSGHGQEIESRSRAAGVSMSRLSQGSIHHGSMPASGSPAQMGLSVSMNVPAPYLDALRDGRIFSI
jgi:DNA-binding transcriptional MocR family regulator